MDKLYRYKGKDYSMCVDFPVEIIGRDGIVRHYSFEESIHLYQRRIRSARMRYEQNEVIVAEINHCSKRIAQLRRSYYARYGWEAFLFAGEIPEELSAELAGELAAYLRRRFGCGIQRDKARVTCMQEDGEHFLFMVECIGSSNILLHLFTNERLYKEYLYVLKSSSGQQKDVEYILDSIEDDDYWLVVTATQSNQSIPTLWSAQELDSILLRDAIQAIHEGNLLEAMAHFMLAIEENPYRRGAYWGTSILAEQMRIHGESELVLQMATNYFPHDAGLWLRLAAALLRRDAKEAKEPLLRAEALNAQLNTDFLWAIYHFSLNNTRRATRHLNKVKRHPNPMLHLSLKWLDSQLHTRQTYHRFALLIVGISVLGTVLHPLLLLINIVTVFLLGYAEIRWKRQLFRALQGKSFHQLTLLPSSDINQITKSFQSSH